jgi:hypothetical protein
MLSEMIVKEMVPLPGLSFQEERFLYFTFSLEHPGLEDKVGWMDIWLFYIYIH